MRFLSLAGLLLLSISSQVAAQGLDIGGIEVRLGQDVTEALRSLATYHVQYDEQTKYWFVTQKRGDDYDFLGHIGAKSGKITELSKGYQLGNGDETASVYTDAAHEVRRRGGEKCVTYETEFTDNLIHQIETRCGAYRLVYSLPFVSDGKRIAAGLSILLSAK